MHAGTKPRGGNIVSLLAVAWPRGFVPVMAGVMQHQRSRATKTSEVAMDARKSDLEQKVLRLSTIQRARLARVLLESLDDETEEDVEAAWAAEAKRRSEELRSGRVKGRTSAQVHARARSALSALR
jgi:putative addiction module component (TIGR02574 family)